MAFEAVSRRIIWEDYLAVGLSKTAVFVGLLSGNESGLPSWVELMYPDVAKGDTRTAEQIKADLLEHLREGGKDDGEFVHSVSTAES